MSFFSGWWSAFAFTGPPTFSNQPPQAGDARTFSKIGWVKIDIDRQDHARSACSVGVIFLCWRHQSKVPDATESDSDDVPMPENWGMQRPSCWNWTWICFFFFLLELFWLFGICNSETSHGCIEMKISYLNSTLESFAGNLAQAKARQFDSTGAASGVLVGTRPAGWIWCRRFAVCSCVEVWPWSSLT